MGEIKQILKIELIIFITTLLILKILMQSCEKLTKNHLKALVFTIWDILQLKKIDDCENIQCESAVFAY